MTVQVKHHLELSFRWQPRTSSIRIVGDAHKNKDFEVLPSGLKTKSWVILTHPKYREHCFIKWLSLFFHKFCSLNIWTPCLLFSKRQMILILTTIFSIIFYRLPERDTGKVFRGKIDKWMLKFECFCAWFYCPNSEITPKTLWSVLMISRLHALCHRQSTYIFLFHFYLCVHGHAAASVYVMLMHICSHGCGGPKSILLSSRSNPSCFWRQSLTGPRSNGEVEADWQPYSSRYPPFCVFPLLWWQVIATNSGPHAHSRNTGPTKLSP